MAEPSQGSNQSKGLKIEELPNDVDRQTGFTFQFIAEQGRGLRASSTTLATIRSQARKYSILKRQMRNASKEPTKAHRKLLPKEPKETLLNPLQDEVKAEAKGSLVH